MLDTNICIEIIRGRNRTVLDRLVQCKHDDLGISCITLAELECGVHYSNNPEKNSLALAKFCSPLLLIPFDPHAAFVYGKIRTTLQQQGTPIGPLDMLISAHAVSRNLVFGD